MLVYCKPGIRPRRHEKSDYTRPRLVPGHNYTLLDVMVLPAWEKKEKEKEKRPYKRYC
jgi:hypothetical protein